MRNQWFSGFLLIFTISCDNGANQSEALNSPAGAILKYKAVNEMPTCDSASEGQLAYSENDKALFICDGSSYVKMSYYEPEDGADPAQYIACESGVDQLPEPSQLNGQIAFKIPAGAAPCSVEGYVVGHQAELKIVATKNGSYFINNVPSGLHDIVITANNSDSMNLAPETKSRGMRINGIPSFAGNSNELGFVTLKPLGEIVGFAKVAQTEGITDHAGISVYIPGTSYAAKTNTNGQYSIANVPPGVHKIFFEKDGFNRGQLSSVVVNSDSVTKVPNVSLNLATIESGTFLINNAYSSDTATFPLLNEPKLEAIMIPPKTASLALLKVNGEPGIWQPIKTNLTYDINLESLLSPGQDYINSFNNITVKVKFADSNGLETDMIEKTYALDLFSDGQSVFKPQFDLASNIDGSFSLSNFIHPSQADTVQVTFDRLQNYDNSPPTYKSEFLSKDDMSTLTITTPDHADNCGFYKTSVTYEGYEGRVRNLNNTGSSEYIAFKKCYNDVTAVNAPKLSTHGNANQYYKATWTGSKVFVLGYAIEDDNPITGGIYDPAVDSWSQISGLDDPILAPPSQPPENGDFDLIASEKIVVFVKKNWSEPEMFFYNLTSNTWFNPLANFNAIDLSDIQNLSVVANHSHILISGNIDCSTYRQNFILLIDGFTGVVSHSAIENLASCENQAQSTLPSFLGIDNPGFIIKSLNTKNGFWIYDERIFHSDALSASDKVYEISYDSTNDTLTFSEHSILPTKILNGNWDSKLKIIDQTDSGGSLYLVFADSYTSSLLLYRYLNENSWDQISLPNYSYYSYNRFEAHIINDQLVVEDNGSALVFLKFEGNARIYSPTSWNKSYTGYDLSIDTWGADSSLVRIILPELNGYFQWGGMEDSYNYESSESDQIERSDGIIYKLDFQDH